MRLKRDVTVVAFLKRGKELRWEAIFVRMPRVAGIEPTQSVLKTDVLPLNYTPLQITST